MLCNGSRGVSEDLSRGHMLLDWVGSGYSYMGRGFKKSEEEWEGVFRVDEKKEMQLCYCFVEEKKHENVYQTDWSHNLKMIERKDWAPFSEV